MNAGEVASNFGEREPATGEPATGEPLKFFEGMSAGELGFNLGERVSEGESIRALEGANAGEVVSNLGEIGRLGAGESLNLCEGMKCGEFAPSFEKRGLVVRESLRSFKGTNTGDLEVDKSVWTNDQR
jgi:hypothetical protein